jgi:hypothetical protein
LKYLFDSHRNLLNLIKSQLVIGSIVELRGARGLVRGNLLGRFESTFILQVNSNFDSPKRMEETGAETPASAV